MRRVLQLALEELARVGVDRLSIPELAEKAGVNKTSIYRRWPTREALVKAALAQPMEHVREVVDTGSLVGDLLVLARETGRFTKSPRGLAAVRAALASGNGARSRALAAELTSLQGTLLREPIARAVRRGELASDADTELLLFTLAGALLHRTFIERRDVDEAWLERLVRLVVFGAAPR